MQDTATFPAPTAPARLAPLGVSSRAWAGVLAGLFFTVLAIAAGAELHEVARVRQELSRILQVEKTINLSRAKEILESIRVADARL